MLSRIFNYIKLGFFKHYGNDRLISEEGMVILNDPEKRIKLRKFIDEYHKTGIWNFKIMD